MKCWLALAVSLALVTGCQKKSPPSGASAEPESTTRRNEAARDGASAAAAPANAGPRADEMKLPHDLGTMDIPADNPQSEAKVALGHQLFFDKRLSVDGSRSCYSCHLNEDGNGGKDAIAIGAQDKKLTRHSPVIWNVGYLPRFYWDGRSATLEEQATAAWAGGNMGVGKENLAKKAEEIGKLPGYKKQFAAVFPGKGATPETVVQALAAYERTLICADTAYDRYAKGDKSALDASQKAGLELFMGKAGCVACHTPPHFSSAFMVKNGTYFNTGVGFDGKKPEEIDPGRKKVTNIETDFAAFKVPSLRNVAKSAPYFHDGSQKTLEGAVRFMASGGFENPNRSPLLVDKKLSEAELASVVSFLRALDCKGKLEEPKLP